MQQGPCHALIAGAAYHFATIKPTTLNQYQVASTEPLPDAHLCKCAMPEQQLISECADAAYGLCSFTLSLARVPRVIQPLETIADHARYDVVVAGAGAAGMAAALYASIAGKTVLLVERTEFLGGTAALSAGTVWAPNTRHAEGSGDTPEQAARFLDNVVGNYARPSMRRAFLASAPEAIATLEDNTDVKFRPYPLHPDYVQEVDGATVRGRALEPLPFDGRRTRQGLRPAAAADPGIHRVRRHDGQSRRHRSSDEADAIGRVVLARRQAHDPLRARPHQLIRAAPGW